MGFFDKVGAHLTNATRTVSQNVKNVSDSSSLNREISSHQKNIQLKYAEIGQLFYEKYCEAPECEFAEQVASIKNSMQEIVKLQAEIQEVKARKAELVPIPEDPPKTPAAHPTAMVCTKCGNTYDTTQVFCSVCGEKLVPQYPTPPQPAETVVPEPVQPTETQTPQPDAKETPAVSLDKDEPAQTESAEPITETQEAENDAVELPMEEPIPSEGAAEFRDIDLNPAPKFCTVCGAENEGDSAFCIQCGSSLN